MQFRSPRFLSQLGTRFLTGILCLSAICLLAMGAVPSAVYAQTPSSAPPLPKAALQQPAADSSYWIWLVLPRLFPEYLPDGGGYLSVGFPWVPGHETPVGIAKTSGGLLGESRQHLDCLACHQSASTKAKATPAVATAANSGGEPAIVKTAFDHSAYAAFLKRCAEDPRFDADYILPSIGYNHKVGWLKGLYYRLQLIPQARRSFLAFASS
jgi:hypothetical protein